MTIKDLEYEEIDQDHTHQQVRVPSVQQLDWITGNVITRPQLLDILQDCTGLEQLVYLYAKVSWINNSKPGINKCTGVRIPRLLHS